MEQYLEEKLFPRAKEAKYDLANLNLEKRNQVIRRIAQKLDQWTDKILSANNQDLEASNLSPALKDRLALNPARIAGMITSLDSIISFPDPLGKILESRKLESGLKIKRITVPIGVIGIIYESRPNVFIDAASLCFKSGNIAILRGSSSAINTNRVLHQLCQESLKEEGLSPYMINFIDSVDRAMVTKLVRANDYLDLIIPRGGLGLKKFIRDNATIPIIETGAGVCHIFVDKSANLDMAVDILVNSKCQRPGTCNAVETVLFSADCTDLVIRAVTEALLARKVKLYYSQELKERVLDLDIELADSSHFGHEFHDLALAGREVKDVHEAIAFINAHSSSHSEAIITEDQKQADIFLAEVDSAVVYRNASTRFSDGGEFGLGGEIGISTQRLHARGPMGLEALCSYKYIVEGKGKIRKG